MIKNRICIGALCLALAGCSGHQAAPGPNSGNTLTHGHVVNPFVVQTGKTPVQWTQFAWGDTNLPHQFDTVVAGKDGNVWYTDYNGHALIQMKMTGGTHLFPLVYNGSVNFFPSGMAVGKDGKFYMGSGQSAGVFGIATTGGAFSTKPVPSGDYSYGGGVALGPDGNVWFTELGHVGKITTGGTITEFPYNDGNTQNFYGAVAAGPDGDVWVTEYNANLIDDVDVSDGSMVSYSLPCSPTGLVSAKDGNLWANCGGQLIRITTSGTYTAFANPFSNDGYPSAFVRGLDGNPWYTVSGRNLIAEFNTQSMSMNVYFPPTTFGSSYGLGAGPDGNMWALDSTGKTNIYIISPLVVAPTSITFHVGNTQTLTVTEKGTSAWTAKSSNPGVASVAQGGQANKFVVTANGLGNTNVTIADAIGNSFVVKVKVN